MLGLSDDVAMEVQDGSGPTGCYWSEISDGVWQLLMVHNPSGHVGNAGMGRPICAAHAEHCDPPSTTTRTTTSSTVETIVVTTTRHTTPPPKAATEKTTGLYCFSVVMMTGYEPKLAKLQYEREASIFECDDQLLFSIGGALKVGSITAVELASPLVGRGSLAKEGQTTNSWLNTEVFMKAWDVVIDSREYLKQSWVIKVDADAVFFPSRLRAHLAPHTVIGIKSPPIFVANCDRKFTNNETFKMKLFGSLEIFSTGAIELYGKHKGECKHKLDWRGWGEDYYMQSCMNLLKVQEADDAGMLGDARCWPAPCTDPSKIAFHDFKDIPAWLTCWRVALGPGVSDAREKAAKAKRHGLRPTDAPPPPPPPAPVTTPLPATPPPPVVTPPPATPPPPAPPPPATPPPAAAAAAQPPATPPPATPPPAMLPPPPPQPRTVELPVANVEPEPRLKVRPSPVEDIERKPFPDSAAADVPQASWLPSFH